MVLRGATASLVAAGALVNELRPDDKAQHRQEWLCEGGLGGLPDCWSRSAKDGDWSCRVNIQHILGYTQHNAGKVKWIDRLLEH